MHLTSAHFLFGLQFSQIFFPSNKMWSARFKDSKFNTVVWIIFGLIFFLLVGLYVEFFPRVYFFLIMKNLNRACSFKFNRSFEYMVAVESRVTKGLTSQPKNHCSTCRALKAALYKNKIERNATCTSSQHKLATCY